MTPLEFRREMAVYHESVREREERSIKVAWLTVAIENDLRAGRGKSLQATIEHYAPRPQVATPPSNVGAQVRSFFSRFGIPEKPMSEETRQAFWTPEKVHG